MSEQAQATATLELRAARYVISQGASPAGWRAGNLDEVLSSIAEDFFAPAPDGFGGNDLVIWEDDPSGAERVVAVVVECGGEILAKRLDGQPLPDGLEEL